MSEKAAGSPFHLTRCSMYTVPLATNLLCTVILRTKATLF